MQRVKKTTILAQKKIKKILLKIIIYYRAKKDKKFNYPCGVRRVFSVILQFLSKKYFVWVFLRAFIKLIIILFRRLLCAFVLN
jgi:hypothetical protein